jgi:amidase
MQDVPPLRVSNQATLTAFAAQARRLLAVAGVGRLPQVVFPAARLGGGPLALSLIGPAGSDLSLVRLACEISGALRNVMVGAGR